MMKRNVAKEDVEFDDMAGELDRFVHETDGPRPSPRKQKWPRWVIGLTVFMVLQIVLVGLVLAVRHRDSSCGDLGGPKVSKNHAVEEFEGSRRRRRRRVSVRKDDKDCVTNLGAKCYRANQTLFNSICFEGDLCFGDEEKQERFGCPIDNAVEDQEMFCILRPHGWNARQVDIAGLSASQLVKLSNETGRWDCKTNTWMPNMQRLLTFDEHTFPQDVDIMTYGDSLSHNIYVGLALVMKGYNLRHWQHNRMSAEIDGGMTLSHFCCFHCGCKADNLFLTTAQVAFKLGINDRLNGRTKPTNAVIIIRESLHIHNNVTAMAEEMTLLLKTVENEAARSGRKTSVIYIPMHGEGVLKPKKYLPEQGFNELRAYSAQVRAELEAYVATNIKHVHFHIFEIFKMFQMAECEENGDRQQCCEGAFESPDGTHLSLTTQVAVAHHLIAFIHALNK